MSISVAAAGFNTYAIGASGGLADAGWFGTIIVGLKLTTSTDNSWQSFVEIEGSPVDIRAAVGRRNDGNVYYANQAALESTPALVVEDSLAHVLVVVTKATGTAVATRHVIPLSSGTRTTVATTATFGNSTSVANGRIKVGGDDDVSTALYWLACAIPGVVLNTTQIDGIITAKTTASVNALCNSNSWLVDAADDLVTDLKGNHSRSATTGVTHSSDDPAGWVFGLTSPDATVTAVVADSLGSAPAATVSAGGLVTAAIAASAGSAPVAGVTASAGVDTFESRSDGTLGAPWATFGSKALPTVASGEVFSSADLTLDAAANPVSIGPDMLSEITFASAPTVNTNLTFDVYTRISALTSGADYYIFRMYSTGWRLYKRTSGGAETIIAQVNPRPETLNTITGLRMTAVGTTLTGFAKVSGAWTQVIQVTDSSITAAGYPGFGTQLASGGANPIGVEEAVWGLAGAVNATVTAVPAVSAGSAPVAAISAGATVTAVPALSLGSAPPANQIISIVVGAPAAVSLGSAPAAAVSAGGSAVTVTAVPASSVGSAPVASVQAGAAVTAVVAASAGSAPVAAVSAGATVAAVPAVSAGSAPRPTITPAPPSSGVSGDVAATFAEASA